MKIKQYWRKFGVWLLIILLFNCANTQNFYTDFGQNRIQHRNFDWKFISKGSITVYYYDSMESLAGHVLASAENVLINIESVLSYKLGGNIKLQLFSGLKDYRQSNVGYVNQEYNTGGFTIIPNDINSLYFNGDFSNFDKLISKSVSDIFLREMLYGGTLQDRLQSSANFNTPKWFIEGLSSYLADNWNANLENKLRDAMQKHGFNNLNILKDEDLELLGHSFWRYLIQTEGNTAITNIIYFLRYTHNVDDALFFQTKKKLNTLLKEWKLFQIQSFQDEKFLSLPKGKASIPRKIAGLKCSDLKISDDGNKVVFVTNDHGKFSVWLYDIKSTKTKHLYTGGSKILNQVSDFSFPKIHFKNANTVGMFIYKNNNYYFMEIDLRNGRKTEKELPPTYSIVDFSYNSTGDSLIFSIVRSEQNELVYWSAKSKNWKVLRSDSLFKFNLVWENDNLFFLEKTNGAMIISKIAVSENKKTNVFQFNEIQEISNLLFYSDSIMGFLSDANGLVNAYILNEHSRNVNALTNYRRSVIAQDISKDKKTFIEMLTVNGLNTIYISSTPSEPESETVQIKFMKWKSQSTLVSDSQVKKEDLNVIQLFQTGKDSIIKSTSDTNTFKERPYTFQVQYPKIDYRNVVKSNVKNSLATISGSAKNELNIDYFITQFDNKVIGSNLHNVQMPLITLRNAALTPLIKASLSDYNKNLILEGGFRTSFNFEQTDYFINGDYLKNRFDYSAEVNRRVRRYSTDNKNYFESIHSQGLIKVAYPIDERLKISFGLGYRKELIATKATEKSTLNEMDKSRTFVMNSFEAVYDNSISLGLNLSKGFKAKIGFESAKNMAGSGMMLNYVMDLRHNLLILKKVIWANRVSGMYALGNRFAATYLGGTENWTSKDQLEKVISAFPADNYYFQQYAANLRGFGRGVRVGSSYGLWNSELRFPLQRLIMKNMTGNEIIRSFQFVFFFDAGTAFTGKSPNSPNNPFNTVYYNFPNYNMSVTSSRNPFVFGQGYGIRVKLWGYYFRYDIARGFVEGKWGKSRKYLSLGLDF